MITYISCCTREQFFGVAEILNAMGVSFSGSMSRAEQLDYARKSGFVGDPHKVEGDPVYIIYDDELYNIHPSKTPKGGNMYYRTYMVSHNLFADNTYNSKKYKSIDATTFIYEYYLKKLEEKLSCQTMKQS